MDEFLSEAERKKKKQEDKKKKKDDKKKKKEGFNLILNHQLYPTLVFKTRKTSKNSIF